MQKLFLGGVPVKPNVDLLIDGLPYAAGDVYAHSSIAEICGEQYGTHRYRTVIASWKNRMRKERGIDIVAEPNVGYRVLRDSERITQGNKEAIHGLRQIKKGGERAMRADEKELTEAERRQRMQLMRMSADLVKIGKDGQHQFEVLGKVTSLPDRIKA